MLQVKAVDGDRGINNDIKYEITGGPLHLFGINQETGLVYSKVKFRMSKRLFICLFSGHD